MTFKALVGQDKINDMFIKSIAQDKLSHAYSFEGAAGMGKFTFAMAFASAILCMDSSGDSCENCSSCSKTATGNHPDLMIIAPQKSSIGIDEIRRLQEHITVKPIVSAKKVYIIDQADKMTTQAQNCLLKTLEEPPADAVVILCISNSNHMLKTIQSRVTKVSFAAYTENEIKQILSRNADGKIQKLEYAVAFSQGVVGKAFSIISDDFLDLREQVFEFITGIKDYGTEELYRASDFFEKNKDIYEDIFDIMTTWYRDLALYQNMQDENVLINCDKKCIIMNGVRESSSDLIRIIGAIQDTRKQLRMNANFQMAIDCMLLNLWEVYNGKSRRSAI